MSEAKFVVRGPAAQSQGNLSSLLASTGLSHAEEDTYAVQDYITSRDALTELVKTQDVGSVFLRPEADFWSRFPRFSFHRTFEHFYQYYQNHVEVLLDSSTGVSTLTVRTFRPDDSERVASALLVSAENLINRMNERQRENAMGDARKEVGVAEARVQQVAKEIAEFRNREALLDPTKQSVPMLAGINELQTMLSRTNLQLSQVTTSTPRSPLISDLRRRAEALQGQITDARSKITGTDASLVPKITAFDMLELQRQFADKQLASATSSLEAERLQSERQQLYLETIVRPNVSDYPAYPKRLASIAVVFACLCGAFIGATLVISGAREHRIA
ncbi:capsule biosynthesis protein [Acidisphaera sp. L21]|uniref:capsule biosynthesis protein n=1 Tax=Acidisphaera sp. L21 TaxID=1641851 RepID=UPI00131B9E2A|nr:capsule biosynthesis protein [Acidisphaera sp. L21]